MLNQVTDIQAEGGTATLTYILNNSPEVDVNRKRPMIIICPGGGYRFISEREAEPIAIRLNAMGTHGLSLATEETRSIQDDRPLPAEVQNWITMAGTWVKKL